VELTAGESTNFTVKYLPTMAGAAQTGTLTITDSRAVTTVALTGSCFNPTISTFPFVEGFETGNTDQSATINQWIQATGPEYTATYWTANSSLTTYNRTPRTGTWNATLQYGGESYLFRPIVLTGGTAYTIKLYARQDGATATNAKLQVKLGTEATIAGMTTSIIPETGLLAGDYQQLAGNFSVANTGTYFIGIQGWINFSPWYISLDDITIDLAPTGPPEAVTLATPADNATGLPKIGFNLTWTPALTGGAATSYTVYMASTAETIYEEEIFNGITGTSFNPVTEGLMTFNYEERWFWTVEAINGSGSAVVDPPFQFDIQADPRVNLPYTQDFGTDGTWPLNWSQSSTGATIWTKSNTANAGGTAYEMKGHWVSLTGTTRLISPPLNTGGMTSFAVSFKTLFDDYAAGITAKLQYSHDLVTWTDSPWIVASGTGNVSGNQTALITGLVSQPTTYVAWTLIGDHFQFDDWFVDDVHISLPANHDVAPISWDVLAEVVPENTVVTPKVTVVNNGLNTETFDVTVVIGTYTDTKTVTGLAMGLTQQVTFLPLTPALWSAENVVITTNLATDEVPANDELTAALICLNLDTPALANNAQTDQFVQFNLAHPEAFTALPNSYTGPGFIAGADWMNGKWMGVEYDDGSLTTDNYYKINPLTGIYQPALGESGVALQGNTWDDTNAIMYGVGADNLYTLDPLTGLATLQGTMWYDLEGTPTNLAGIGGLMISIAYDNFANVLYGIDLGNDCLWTINPVTYELTLVGFMGIDINYAQDAAFDQTNGLLFLAGYSTFGGLYWIDTDFGGAYLVGSLGSAGYECTALAIPYGDLDTAPVVTISGTGTLAWTAVPGAVSYNVYSSDDPYGTYTLEANVRATQYIGSPAAKKFYKVTALGGRALSSRPELLNNVAPRSTRDLGVEKRFNTGLAK
jgi:hypothetical protein